MNLSQIKYSGLMGNICFTHYGLNPYSYTPTELLFSPIHISANPTYDRILDAFDTYDENIRRIRSYFQCRPHATNDTCHVWGGHGWTGRRRGCSGCRRRRSLRYFVHSDDRGFFHRLRLVGSGHASSRPRNRSSNFCRNRRRFD